MANDPRAGSLQAFIRGVKPGRPQSGVAFNRRVDISIDGTVVSLPGSILPLAVEDAADQAAAVGKLVAQQVERQQPFRLDAGVGFQDSRPRPVVKLLFFEPALSCGQRFMQWRVKIYAVGWCNQ